MIDPHLLIDILLKALEAAPAPLDGPIASVHPEDVQKWSERYKIWYRDIRTHILVELVDQPKDNIYYQIDRLVQDAKAIQADLQKTCKDEAQKIEPKQTRGISIGSKKI